MKGFLLASLLLFPAVAILAQDLKFKLGTSQAAPGWTAVPADAAYSLERGHGFEPGYAVAAVDQGKWSYATSDAPFYFSVALPEGNYRVRLSLGDHNGETRTTVKAELRRLMLEETTTRARCVELREFIVNLRRPQLPDGGEVRLKPRERAEEAWAWDDKLTLEFNGARPSVGCIEITRVEDLPAVYLLGDSTVADQPREPYASWGQMLPRFFNPTVAIANHSESGESLASFLSERRLEKVLSIVRPGDWVIVQFGHNDMKKDDVATYTANLKKFTAALGEKKAAVVLVTPMHRHTFDADGKIVNSHKDYPDAVRAVALEENLPLIDLHAMSAELYEALGPEKSLLAFKPGDATHHNPYGAYQLAKCVIEGLREKVPALATHVLPDLPRFDPARPDPVDTFSLPLSPTPAAAKPDGS